jgi:DNA-binding transcriptional regulator YdaS (Cro superfamily)
MAKDALKKAIQLAGGQSPLAAGIRGLVPASKVSQAHVWKWLNGKRVDVPPAEYVIPIAQFLGWKVTPHELRPDLHPNTTDALPKTSSLALGDAP